ncbi:MAG TPA: hypothetical protein VJ570_13905, partial [Holophagaceae bacterium]|nr:hypothetical protein [Holophagaceae bacterium]
MRLFRALPSLTLMLAACGLAVPLTAQAPPDKAKQEPAASEAALKEELDILLNIEIISVSKVAQRPIDAPGVVSAIQAETLRDYGWTSLNEVMGNQPGFVPSQDYDRRTLSARGVYEGWNNNHIL